MIKNVVTGTTVAFGTFTEKGFVPDSTESTGQTMEQAMTASSTDVNEDHSETSTNNLISYWIIDSYLFRQRAYHDAVILANGKVMICGGRPNSTAVMFACELHSSSTGWTLGRPMNVPRYYHTMTLFANRTKVLAAGTAQLGNRETAEVYNSTSNTWALTATNMTTTRRYHAALLLKNEQILIMGGENTSGSVLSSTELFTPSSNSFTKTNSMNIGRVFFSSTLLNDQSTILVAGGFHTNKVLTTTAELYVSGSWIFTKGIMTQSRAYHATVLLSDGNVLIAGGGDNAISYSTAEIYNATTRTFTAVQSMKYRRESFTLTVLPLGQVLATGGVDKTTNTYPVTCELYDPITQTWSDTRMLNNGRSFHRSVLLNDSVLTIGGNNGGNVNLNSCEKYYL